MIPIAQVNWLAVVVGTVFSMALGFLWYGPMFGKPWTAVMKKMGRKQSDMRMTPVHIVLPVVANFATALVLDLIVLAFGGTAWWFGLVTGAIVSVGLSAAATLVTGLYESRPFGLFFIYGLYLLVLYGAEGIMFAVWR